MKVTGFSFIKNAVNFDFPIKEALLSILPLCDEIVVAVGDGTRELVQAVHPTKIKIIDTVWNPNLNRDGIVLADETNKALKAIGSDSDWLIYIQGDEVMHEAGHAAVLKAMQQYKDDKRVDGLLFKYLHFYGSYDYVATSSRWYRKEIRVIKNDKTIYSYKDAQGFRKGNDVKLNVKPVDAYIHHYGWVREPSKMNKKIVNTGSIWGGSDFTEDHIKKSLKQDFDYSGIDALEKFTGSHPNVFDKRVASINWKFDYELSFNNLTLKDKIKNFIEKITGKRFFDYQNYKII
jgi:hypothetical protein